MQTTIFYLYIFILWLIFWSFGSVLIARFHNKKWWIINWRSECINCQHKLWTRDLVPVFSYLFSMGKCRYCKSKISLTYPLLEITMWIFWLLSSYYLVNINLVIIWNIEEIIKLIFFIFISFCTVIFIFYDIKFIEIPDEIMVPSIIILFLLLVFDIFFPSFNFLFGHFEKIEFIKNWNNLLNWLFWAILIYSFFYIQIFIPWAIHLIQSKKYKILFELTYLYIIFPLVVIFDFFNINKNKNLEEVEHEEEIPSWIGWWDLRIAIFMWLVAWLYKSLLALWIAYIIWSIVWIIILIKKWKQWSQIPFWPFLGIWLFISLFWYQDIINLYFQLLGLNF